MQEAEVEGSWFIASLGKRKTLSENKLKQNVWGHGSSGKVPA
jgi:hypothetical protein